jgi:hypothetical protein
MVALARDDTAEARSVAPGTVGRTFKRLLELDVWQFTFIRDSSGSSKKQALSLSPAEPLKPPGESRGGLRPAERRISRDSP